MRIGTKISGIVAATVLAMAGRASAASMVLTLDGTVTGAAYDYNGLFGPAFAQLSGDVRMQMFYDPDLGRRDAWGPYDSIDGGTGYAPFTFTSPITSVTITVNGVSTSFSAPYSGEVRKQDGSYLYVRAFGDLPAGGQYRPYAGATINGISWPTSLDEAYASSSGCLACASFSISKPVPGQNYDYTSYAIIDVKRVSIAAVPEPATWALMIGGFGMAGAALRRRRTSAVAA